MGSRSSKPLKKSHSSSKEQSLSEEGPLVLLGSKPISLLPRSTHPKNDDGELRFSSCRYFSDQTGQIKPSWLLHHWCIKFGSLIYNLLAEEDNFIQIVRVSDRESLQYKYEKVAKLKKKQSQVLKLIEDMNSLKLKYKLLDRNCQHAACSIGNYASGRWNYQQSLKYFKQ